MALAEWEGSEFEEGDLWSGEVVLSTELDGPEEMRMCWMMER
jgi:hypothetical protein